MPAPGKTSQPETQSKIITRLNTLNSLDPNSPTGSTWPVLPERDDEAPGSWGSDRTSSEPCSIICCSCFCCRYSTAAATTAASSCCCSIRACYLATRSRSSSSSSSSGGSRSRSSRSSRSSSSSSNCDGDYGFDCDCDDHEVATRTTTAVLLRFLLTLISQTPTKSFSGGWIPCRVATWVVTL